MGLEEADLEKLFVHFLFKCDVKLLNVLRRSDTNSKKSKNCRLKYRIDDLFAPFLVFHILFFTNVCIRICTNIPCYNNKIIFFRTNRLTLMYSNHSKSSHLYELRIFCTDSISAKK